MSKNENDRPSNGRAPQQYDPGIVALGRKISRRRRIKIAAPFVILASLWLAWQWYARTDPLRFKYLKASVDLVVDGEPIKINGLLECEYHWGTLAIGGRFKPSEVRGFVSQRPSGGAIVVSVPSCKYSRYSRSPVVHLLDDPDRPTRIEYHFSEQALSDPASRVHIVRYNAELDGRSPISQWWRLWQLTAFEDAIGWARDDAPVKSFRGYMLTLSPRKLVPVVDAFAPFFDASVPSLVSYQDTDDPEIKKSITDRTFTLGFSAHYRGVPGCALNEEVETLRCFQFSHFFGAPPTSQGFSFDDPTKLFLHIELLAAPAPASTSPHFSPTRVCAG